MKKLTYILCGLIILLAVVITQIQGRNKARLQQIEALTNQVNELRLKLNHEELMTAVWSNKYTQVYETLERHLEELSNLRKAFTATQHELQTAQSQLQKLMEENQILNGVKDEFQERILELEAQLKQAQESATYSLSQLQRLSEEHNKLAVAYAHALNQLDQLKASLTNANFLWACLKSLNVNQSTVKTKAQARGLRNPNVENKR